MILTHYSDEPIAELKHAPNFNQMMKPIGLWLSDDSDYGWAEWCKDNEFRVESLDSYKYEVEVDTDKVRVITNPSELNEFTCEYLDPEANPLIASILWKRVAEDYKGIIISPYQFVNRLKYVWYYGWDCASGCVWDMTAIKKMTDCKTGDIIPPGGTDYEETTIIDYLAR